MKKLTIACSLATLLVVSACGGGGSDNATTGTPVVSPGTEPSAYAPDLQSFAVAWIALNLSLSAADMLHMAGNTGNCGGGGQTAYDLGAVRQTAQACVLKTNPVNAYTGGFSLTYTNGVNTRASTISSPALQVAAAAAPKAAQFSIDSGVISGIDDFSNDTADVYSAVTFSLQVTPAGAATPYRVGTNGPGTLTQSFANGTPALVVSSLDIGVNRAQGAWRLAVRGVATRGDSNPDAGSITVADQSKPASEQLTVSFGAGNNITFSAGGRSVTKLWGDADVRAALAAART